jgi:hypothetical protein
MYVEGNWLDEAWNDVLIQNADDAVEFFMPDLAADRDRSRGIEFLSEDLPRLGADTSKGKRIVDICLSIYLSGGGIQRVALVAEQQHLEDPDFARRMYTTFYRASDRLQYPVTSLAIFTGKSWYAGPYEYECYGTRLRFEYNSYRVVEADIGVLRKDKRPFAVVVLAAALMLEAGGNPNDREKYARELLNLMTERNYDKRRKKALFEFIRRVLRIKDGDMSQKIKEEWNMRAIPIEEAAKEVWIRHARDEGMDKGMEKGEEKKAFEVARSMLADGFPAETIRKHTGLDESSILSLS